MLELFYFFLQIICYLQIPSDLLNSEKNYQPSNISNHNF